jgi:hypothetical protein
MTPVVRACAAMFRCRECEVILQEGRNWHASYAARNYRHCMDCARAYSRRRYGRIKPTVKRRVPTAPALAAVRVGRTRREWTVDNRAAIARERRDRAGEREA